MLLFREMAYLHETKDLYDHPCNRYDDSANITSQSENCTGFNYK